jgi:hypothetical protein
MSDGYDVSTNPIPAQVRQVARKPNLLLAGYTDGAAGVGEQSAAAASTSSAAAAAGMQARSGQDAVTLSRGGAGAGAGIGGRAGQLVAGKVPGRADPAAAPVPAPARRNGGAGGGQEGRVGRESRATPAEAADAGKPDGPLAMYNHPTDKNAAATRVAAARLPGSMIDVRG